MPIRPVLVVLALAAGVCHPLAAQTQHEMNEGARREFEEADARLNRLYRQILDEYRQEAAFLRRLRAAQRAWVAFRDAQVKAIFPKPNPQVAYGSVYPLCRYRALTDLTNARSAQLEAWTKGVDETDTCGGSRKPAGGAGPRC